MVAVVRVCVSILTVTLHRNYTCNNRKKISKSWLFYKVICHRPYIVFENPGFKLGLLAPSWRDGRNLELPLDTHGVLRTPWIKRKPHWSFDSVNMNRATILCLMLVLLLLETLAYESPLQGTEVLLGQWSGPSMAKAHTYVRALYGRVPSVCTSWMTCDCRWDAVWWKYKSIITDWFCSDRHLYPIVLYWRHWRRSPMRVLRCCSGPATLPKDQEDVREGE